MPKDILLTANFNLLLENGDFAIGESTYQHQNILIHGDKGELKQSPTRCVGAKRFLECEKPDNLAREIRQELRQDGMEVRKIEIDDNLEINIEANY